MAKKNGILRNIFTVGAFTMLSRVLGLAREMLQSRFIGAGVEQSAFTLAFAIPNMARKLFGEGALTAAFVPIFKGEVEREGLEKAARLARAVMTMVLLLLGSVIALAMTTLSCISFTPGRARLTAELVFILCPYMLAICGAAFGMGVVNALGKFRASSFMPALLNLLWIAALATLALMPSLDTAGRIRFVAAAILLGGFVQMGFMFWAMHRAGVSPWPRFTGWGDAKVRLVWSNLGVAALGAGAVQVNYMLDQVLGQLAAPWAAGVIGYAERLMDLPLGVIGVAFGTVLLPTFAGFFARGDLDGARAALGDAMRNMLFIMLPAAAGLCAVAGEVTGVIYEGGSFDAMATTRVSRALAVYALGLGFFGLRKSLIPWFQAQGDMKTPLKISVATVILNATLNILAVWLLPVEWRHVGLAVSTVVCAAVGCGMLLTRARRRHGALGLGGVAAYVTRALAASAAMGAAVFALNRLLVGHFSPLPRLAVDIAAGAAVYGALAVALRLLPKRRRRSVAQG